MKTQKSAPEAESVQIEVPLDKLRSLMNKGELCASEIRSLNNESKKYIWNLCLSSCLQKH
jgi:hypothetical protein